MRRSTLFWGAILILAGILFLLNNLGILTVDVWNLIWPVFLIALGVWTLLGFFFRGSSASEHANIPLEGASRARVRVSHGAGRLQITAGADPGDLLVGDFGGGLEFVPRQQGDLLEVTLKPRQPVFPVFWWPGYPLDWSFGFTPDVPLELDLETGASESRIDLSGLQVTRLGLKTGASSTHVTLPSNAGMTRVDISTGAAAVDLRVPSGVAARIRMRGGLSSLNVDSQRFPRMGNVYQSSDFDTAANKAEIDVEAGVGAVNVH